MPAASAIVQQLQFSRSLAARAPTSIPATRTKQVHQQRGPGIIVCRRSRDCRVMIVSHKPIIMIAAAHRYVATQPDVHE